MNQHISRVVDLTDPKSNRIFNMTAEEATACLRDHPAESLRRIEGSFALLAQSGKKVRMARSMDRPMRYFLAKRAEGPALVVADRIDSIHAWLKSEGLDEQFHPSYTRMVPAHHIVEIELVGCPDPDPIYTRFFNPSARTPLSNDLDEIGEAYIGAASHSISQWLAHLPNHEPIGVCFSGGIDSGAVFLLIYHHLLKQGLNPSRLKAFTLHFEESSDRSQAKSFLDQLGLGLFWEPVAADISEINAEETVRITEDYKPLDIQCAAMGLALCRGIRRAYPDWRYLADGDGGDENLKDYPIEENPELTIRSVINNQMLYQEGWGVGKIKHSLTYSGGLSRSYTRTYAPARRFGFEGFSPFTQPEVIEVAEAIPFKILTEYEAPRLYALKGEIVSRGIRRVAGIKMPVFPKQRFQHGALNADRLRQRLPSDEAAYRKMFLALY